MAGGSCVRVSGFRGFGVSSFGCRVSGSAFQVPGVVFRVSGVASVDRRDVRGELAPGFGFRIPGIKFRVLMSFSGATSVGRRDVARELVTNSEMSSATYSPMLTTPSNCSAWFFGFAVHLNDLGVKF